MDVLFSEILKSVLIPLVVAVATLKITRAKEIKDNAYNKREEVYLSVFESLESLMDEKWNVITGELTKLKANRARIHLYASNGTVELFDKLVGLLTEIAKDYVKATAQKKIIDDANMFASYSNQFYERNAEEQSIIREAVRQIQQYDIYTQSGRAEAIRIMAEACSALKKIENANKEVVTPTPQPAATPAPPAADSPAPQPSRDDDWDIMFRGQEIADAILQHLIPEYNQTAKQYAGLTGNQDRFPILEEPGAAFEQWISIITE